MHQPCSILIWTLTNSCDEPGLQSLSVLLILRLKDEKSDNQAETAKTIKEEFLLFEVISIVQIQNNFILDPKIERKQFIFYFQMPLADYDVFALRSYSFAVKKTNSFFSLGTILLSLLILSLSVIVSFDTIKHLWIPKTELNISQMKSIVSSTEPLTFTLICIQPLSYTSDKPFPSTKLRNIRYEQIPYKFVSEAEVTATYPKLKKHIGSNFACLNLAGLNFNSQKDMIILEVAVLQTNVFFVGTNFEGILYDNFIPPPLYVAKYSPYWTHLAKVSFIQSTIRDKLYINYEPERIYTFKPNLRQGIRTDTNLDRNKLPKNTTLLIIKPDQIQQMNLNVQSNMESISIQRYDIGLIIGTFLTWLSIFTLIFSYIVGPIMDASLNLVLIQTIFHLDPSTRKPSVFKFLVASLKSGIFEKQDKFIKINEKLEQLKDVGFIMKLQLLFNAINPYRSQNNDAIVVSEHSFGEAKEEIGIETYEQPVKNRIDIFEGSEDEQKVSLVVKLRQKILKFLDSGSDTISINFQGKGYGSVLSLSVTLLFAAGLLAFFLIFGLFKSSTTISDVNLVSYEDITHTISKDLIFIANQNTDNKFKFYIMDGYYNIIRDAPIQPYSDCRSRMPSRMNTPQIDGWQVYCFGDDINITKSTKKQNEIYIYADFQRFQWDDLRFYYDTTSIKYGKPVQQNQYKNPYINAYDDYAENECRQFSIKKISYQNDTDTDQFTEIAPPTQTRSCRTTSNRIGFFYRLKGERQVTYTTSTFFDIIQNLWSLATLCITMVLMKLTKYINLRKKEQVLSSERSDYRDNICILLSKLNGLLQGKNRKQIQSLKYYLKTPLQKVS